MIKGTDVIGKQGIGETQEIRKKVVFVKHRKQTEKTQNRSMDAIEKQRIEKNTRNTMKWCLEHRSHKIGIIKNKNDK